MRIFVAGATGAIGRQLVPMLLERGHTVVGITRSRDRAAELNQLGATGRVCDVYDLRRLETVVKEAEPDALIHQLTAFPQRYALRRRDVNQATDRIRREGTRNLIAAAHGADCHRLIAQSIAFLYKPAETKSLRTETDRPFTDAPSPFAATVAALLDLESQILADEATSAAILRFGWLYGPGTWYAPDGYFSTQIRRRRYPIVGHGSGIWSFVHVADAAAATVKLAECHAQGVYNIVDDEPAPMRDWLPVLASALGAPPPRRVPRLVARLAAGALAAEMSTSMPGASNAKVKQETGWQPIYTSWRDGFAQSISNTK
jgi:nucleoside-diphosphate-sugar epimerase